MRLDLDTSIQTSVHQLLSASDQLRGCNRKRVSRAWVEVSAAHRTWTEQSDVVWNELQHSRVLWILHHPRYAGAFCFGRTHTRLHPDGHQTLVKVAPEEWTALIRDAHEGYITWDQFEQNVQRLLTTLRL